MSDNDEDGPAVTLVFCTAEIPMEIIDKFITRTASWLKAIEMSDFNAVHIQKTLSILKKPEPSQPPTQPFESPFLGKSVSEMRDWFGENVPKHSSWKVSGLTFVILDKESISEETCEIVSDNVDGGEARSDFYVAIQILMGPEMGTHELNEGNDSPHWQENGRFVYSLEKHQAHMDKYLTPEARAFTRDS